MIKRLVILCVAFAALNSFAQEGTASPYSFYGIGSLKFKGTVENRSMGGLSIYTDSIHVNLRNPASYGGLNLAYYNNEGRPVKFTVGGTNNRTKLKTKNESDKKSNTTFDYLAVALPAGKLGFGFGLMPYTAVGYKIKTYNNNKDLDKKYSGSGGVNKTFLAAGYQINKNLSFGIDASYNFGNIKGKTIGYNYDQDGNLLQYLVREDNRSDVSGFQYNFGLNYQAKLKNKLQLTAAATFTPKAKLQSKNKRSLNTITINNVTGQEFVVNTIDADLESQNLKKTNLVLPANFSMGAGLGKSLKWFVGVESNFTQTSKFSNPLYSSAQTNYEDANSVSLGGFFIPDYNAYNNYLKRMVYRAGFRAEKTGLKINNESIKEFGISFGVGLPVGNLFSNANLGFEIGKRGTTNKNLVQGNFMNFQLSLSLNDRWFRKQKYN